MTFFNRVAAAREVRAYLGHRLVRHDEWESRYDYSGRPAGGSVRVLRQVGHHHGRSAQIPRVRANVAVLGVRGAEINQMRVVDAIHAGNGWERAFGYSVGVGPLSGDIFEARSLWWPHGAHLGDTAKTDFAVYQALGLEDPVMTEAQIDAHFTIAEMLVELFGMDRLSQSDHGSVPGNATSCAGLYRQFINLDRVGRSVPGTFPTGGSAPAPPPPTGGDQVITQLPTLRQSWFRSGDPRNAAPTDAVRRLQSLLAIAGVIEFTRVNFPQLPSSARPDGLFGPSTVDAVKAFQRSAGLQVDGVVGAFTWARLLGV